jgi:meso-butanediol dehydrogenase / (S,S)-butanediol dehydrogenase / diacetyl reductase
MINLNLLGVVRCCRAAIPHLRRSSQGPAIVTIGSINALMALGSEPYSSAKAGLGALTLNLAAQLGPSGIRVNLIAPGTIRTPVWDGQPGGADRYAGSYPLQRVGEPGCGCRGRISCFFRCSADNRPNSGRRRRPALDL